MGHERPGILFAKTTGSLALEKASRMQTFVAIMNISKSRRCNLIFLIRRRSGVTWKIFPVDIIQNFQLFLYLQLEIMLIIIEIFCTRTTIVLADHLS